MNKTHKKVQNKIEKEIDVLQIIIGNSKKVLKNIKIYAILCIV